MFEIQDAEQRKSRLPKEFLFLKSYQIVRRFGVDFDGDPDPLFEQTPTFEEFELAFQKALRENQVLCSCGVRTEKVGGQTLVHLEGLENYFAT